MNNQNESNGVDQNAKFRLSKKNEKAIITLFEERKPQTATEGIRQRKKHQLHKSEVHINKNEMQSSHAKVES